MESLVESCLAGLNSVYLEERERENSKGGAEQCTKSKAHVRFSHSDICTTESSGNKASKIF